MRLRRVTVIGAGVMGSGIAAHLANAGAAVHLLDVAPDDAHAAGRDARNRMAAAGKERALRASPPAFYAPDLAGLVSVGNVEDDLTCVQESDWVIEAVVENLAAKQAVLEKVERFVRPTTIVSTNTSGLSVTAMAAERSPAFRRRFLGTHFFNPPRYMKLVEIIPGQDTLPEVTDGLAEVITRDLGKGIVFAKDTPNFIANRIGAFTSSLAVKLAVETGYTVEEVDELTGRLIGRPRTGTFRLADLVGLDTAYSVRKNVYDSLVHDPDREVFAAAALLRQIVERGRLGEKTGAGFYTRQEERTLVLDLATLEYRPEQTPAFASVAEVRAIPELGERVRTLLRGRDRAATFVWVLVSRTLLYAARVLPEISDDIVNVDRAMRWGFNWELGPFELWDALGPAHVASRLADEGVPLPPAVRRVVDSGGTFYRRADGAPHFFDVQAGAYRPVPALPGVLSADLARGGRVVEHNADASLLDLGDGVAGVEFHSALNVIGADTVRMLSLALDRLDTEFDALVIGTRARDFSVGANLAWLLLEAEGGRWEEMDLAVREFQRVIRRIRRSPKPVVGAPAGRTLAGGAEICLACPRLQAAAETYVGLVETAVGLVPAGGGTTEMVRRAQARIPAEVTADLYPFIRWTWETISRARVSQSALEARQWGYLREHDGITMNTDCALQDAKDVARAMARAGYRSPLPARIRVVGQRGRAGLESVLYILKTGGHITAYDEVVGRKLAYVMAGGDVPEGTWVTEEYLLDLEREAFLSLLGEARTQERMRHMLQTGKPLRN
jgi:3-hydroxyacyl-CoA dehydrogenase